MNRFNNPLKLQQGGTTEDARTQVISVISEVAGITPEEVDSKLAQLSQNEEAVQLLSQGLQLLKEGNQEGVTIIKQLFSPQSAKNGGKIHDFICKHAKGGKVDCGCNVEKAQFGGLVVKGLGGMSMGDAMEQAMSSKGYNKSQARFAYTNAKNALRSQGLRGSELRQQARQMLAGNSEVEVPVARPSLASKPVATIDESSLVKPMLEGNLDSLAGGSAELQLRNNSKMIQDYSNLNFNSAFAAARNAYLNNNGANTFNWKGKTYNTDLASGSTTNSTPIRSREEVAQTNQNTAMVQPGGGNTSWMWSAFNRVFGKKENGGIIEAQGGTAIPGFQEEGMPYKYERMRVGMPETHLPEHGMLIDTTGMLFNGTQFKFDKYGREIHGGDEISVNQNWINHHPRKAKYYNSVQKLPIVGKKLVVRPDSYFEPIAKDVTETLQNK